MVRQSVRWLVIGVLFLMLGVLLGQPAPSASAQEPQEPASAETLLPPQPLTASDFVESAPQGFGDRQNNVAWSMAWWKQHVYVGTGRSYACIQAAIQQVYYPFLPYPPRDPEIDCAPTPQDLPLQAEIWRWTPATNAWDRVYQSPENIEIPGHPGKFVSPDVGFRGMTTHREASGQLALYVSGYSSRDFNEPGEDTQALPYPRILRSVDGTTFEPIPQDPGTFLGELDDTVDCEDHDRVYGFREMTSYDGRLYVVAGGGYGDGCVIESDDPELGNSTFRQITPYEMDIASMAPFNGYLYLGTGENPIPPVPGVPGYTIYKTTAQATLPYTFTPVVTDGGCRPDSKTITHFMQFRNRLYAGTNQPAELIRVNPDDTWDLLMGDPRTCPNGETLTPLSGFGDGFDWALNIHVHRMQSHEGVLYVGTNDHSTALRDIRPFDLIARGKYGFDLYSTVNGTSYTPITIQGLDDPYSESARTFASTRYGLFLGTQNNYYGLRVWQGLPAAAGLSAPTSLSGEVAGQRRAVLAWEPVAGATRYRVFRSTFTSNAELGIAEVEADAWLPGAFVEMGVTAHPYFLDVTARPESHFYHYYVVAENAAGAVSGTSNFARVPSLAATVTLGHVQGQLARWSTNGVAVADESSALLAQARRDAAAGNVDGVLLRVARLRDMMQSQPPAALPSWRVADAESLLLQLEQRAKLAKVGLLAPSALD